MKQQNRLRILTYVVIVYMLLAFTWWSVLLFVKNQDAFQAKAELLRIGMIADNRYIDDEAFQNSPDFISLKKKYQSQVYMILGESGVFVITLIVGVWLINRGYRREVEGAQQRRNFLLSITHELKSPIASIRLVLDTFRKRQLVPAQVEQLCTSGLQETERLHGLVNDLLLSAKLDTAYEPFFEQFSLSDLLQQILEKIQLKYPNGQFSFSSNAQHTEIRADRSGMSSVIWNLLENAVKYSDMNPVVDVRIQNKDHKLQLEIADQGIGIPDKEKNKIFDKFYRVGNEDTRKTKGTGLGLYIVHEIVRAHEGTIQVKNNSPKGTKFMIMLPLERSKGIKPRAQMASLWNAPRPN